MLNKYVVAARTFACSHPAVTNERYGVWKYLQRIDFDADGKIVRYTINFYRERDTGDWYDEIRYDSHEFKRGRDVEAPHFHMKLHSQFKSNLDAAVEEIKGLIDNQVEEIAKVLRR